MPKMPTPKTAQDIAMAIAPFLALVIIGAKGLTEPFSLYILFACLAMLGLTAFGIAIAKASNGSSDPDSTPDRNDDSGHRLAGERNDGQHGVAGDDLRSDRRRWGHRRRWLATAHSATPA